MVTVSGLLGISLALRCGVSKRLEFFCGRFRLEQTRENGNVDAETTRIGELRHQTKIGDSRRIAKTKRSNLARDQLLACAKTFAVGPRCPVCHLLFGKTELAQAAQDFQVLDRMGVTG